MQHSFLMSIRHDSFPIIKEEYGRVQIVFDPDTYGMLLYNERMRIWCGYILVTQAQMQILEDHRYALGISYAAPAGRPITWMAATEKDGKLRNPVQVLTDSAGGDFWVGLHFDPKVDSAMAKMLLSQFCGKVKEALSVDSFIRRQAWDHSSVRPDMG